MLQLSPAACGVLLLQRTHYQPKWVNYLRRIRLGALYDAGIVRVSTPRQRRQVAEAYERELRTEFEGIEPYLPVRAKTVMDIGCGLGGIAMHVYDKYNKDVLLIMVDRDEHDRRPYYGFEAAGSAYNSLEVTSQFLTSNGVDPASVRTVNVVEDTISQAANVDVVMSLISWGFHYPVGTYLEDMATIMRPGGTLILDVRKGTGGLVELEATAKTVESIAETKAYVRVCARMP